MLLALTVPPMLAACGGPAAAFKLGPEAIAIQQAEVSGLSRCSQSGPPDAVVRALRDSGDTNGADELAGNWSDDQGRGGQNAYVVGYATSSSDCLPIFGSFGSGAGSVQNKWIVNYIVTFSSDSKARANWAQRAAYLQNFSHTTGKSTGLGDNAVVIDGYPPQWAAFWSSGSSYSILATNYDAPTARTIAAKVAARMTK